MMAGDAFDVPVRRRARTPTCSNIIRSYVFFFLFFSGGHFTFLVRGLFFLFRCPFLVFSSLVVSDIKIQ